MVQLPPYLRDLVEQMVAESDEFMKALGRFSIQFLALEEDIDRTIHELLGLEPETGFAVTSAIYNVSTRLEILQRLASDLPMKSLHRGIVLKAVDAAVDLNSYRNWLFHSSWSVGNALTAPSDDDLRTHQKRRMVPKKGRVRDWQRKAFTVSEINERSKAIGKLRGRLSVVIQRLSHQRISKKQREQAE